MAPSALAETPVDAMASRAGMSDAGDSWGSGMDSKSVYILKGRGWLLKSRLKESIWRLHRECLVFSW